MNSAFQPSTTTATATTAATDVLPPLSPDAPNGGVILRYNQNRAEAGDVLRSTSRMLRDYATDWPVAQGCLDALRSARHPVTGLGIEPNPISFNVAMATCGKWGLAEESVRWFNDMLARSIAPDLQSYSTVIHCCRNAGRPDLALGLLQHLLDHGPQRGLVPGVELFNLVLSSCEKSGRIFDVLGLFDYLVERGPALGVEPDLITYNTVIWACSKAGRHAEARIAFDRLQDGSGSTGLVPDLSTYNALLSACPADLLADTLDMAVEQQLLQPSLGLDRARNRLNLHNVAAVMEKPRTGERSNCVHPEMGRAIFRHLMARGLIDPRTRFVVGVQGSDKLALAIADCIREQGWLPCHPTVDPAGEVEDFGMLMSVVPAGSRRSPELNPEARAFRPGQPVARP